MHVSRRKQIEEAALAFRGFFSFTPHEATFDDENFKFAFQFTFCLFTSRDNFSFAFSPSCLDYFKLSRKSLFARWKCFHLKLKKFLQQELSQIEKIKKQQKKGFECSVRLEKF